MKRSPVRKPAQWRWTVLVTLYAVLISSYFVLRYAGQWMDSDTANLTAATAAVADDATLVPTGKLYGLGFAYQAVTMFITSTTGIPLMHLQLLAYPVVAAGLSWIAFAAYRALTGSAASGALATVVLFMQPDFLFVIFRGSHEKVTWLAVMLAILLLAQSLGAGQQPWRFAGYVALFYLAAFAIVASNSFFGSSFILAVVISLAAGLLVTGLFRASRFRSMSRHIIARLVYVTSSALVLWFLNLFYIYRPALRLLNEIDRVTNRAVAVGLGHEPAFDPYATISWGWVSQAAYLSLIVPSLLVGIASLLLWLDAARRLLQRQAPFEDPPRFLMWLLYGGFGVQLAVSVVVARIGGSVGNLQVRLFPLVLLMACPFLADAATRIWQSCLLTRRRRLFALVLALLAVWFSAASLLKATSDPWLSNYWRFWTASEDRGVRWAESHVRFQYVWLGLDGIRLSSYAVATGFPERSSNTVDTAAIDPETKDIILSSVDRSLSVRRSAPLPDVSAELCVYDSGAVELYHRRPRTPYQR